MFGRRKRSSNKIEGLARAAQATIGMALMQHYRAASRAGNSEEQTRSTQMAAAAANFLNGYVSHPEHAELDQARVQTEARNWLQQNPAMRELVVQTLRVTAVVHDSAKAKAPTSEESVAVLAEFGGDAADKPDPHAYEALVRRAIGMLPHHTQIQLMRLAEGEE